MRPRPAATVILLREGPEVLLLRRHTGSGFAPDAWVFPGGTVDEADVTLDPARWRGIAPDRLAARFRAPAELVLGLHVAATRETFEEAGVLLGTRADGTPIDLADPAVQAARARLIAPGGTGAAFTAWLAAEDLVLELGRLHAWSRWITPRARPRRYDTAFFLAHAPEDQVADHDRVETTDQRWMRPAEALRAVQDGELTVMYPTGRTLQELAACADADAIFARAAAQAHEPLRPILPHIDTNGDRQRILHPDDPDFPHHAYADEPQEWAVVGS